MNQLLLSTDQIDKNGKVKITGNPLEHIRKILKLGLGETIRIGIVNGSMGIAHICSVSDKDFIEIEIDTNTLKPPPKPPNCKVVMALPRPKMMRRVFQNLSSLGIKEIHSIHSWRVEKSFWQTPWLKPEIIEQQLVLGLEQSMDTIIPSVSIHKLFKPFAEDQLPEILDDTLALVAHPYTEQKCPIDIRDQASTLIIGPEGGFTEYEIEKIVEAGAQSVSIGPRILRVETAVPVLISRLYPS